MDIHNLNRRERREQRKQHMRLDFPLAYGISLGEYNCNRVCRMCPMYRSPPEKERYIADDVMERACREVGERPCNIELSAFGETFLHPKADDYLFLVRRLCPNAEIVVATNGSLLNRERCEKIVDSGVDHLSFSLDAGSPESYAWLCKSTSYEQTCRNLETLVEVLNKRNAKHLRITNHIIGIKELAHEFEGFEKRWSGLVDQVAVRPYGNWAGMVDGNGVTPAEKQVIPEERYPCTWLWYATKIEPNGDVSKCFIHVTGDKNPLGNIMQESFESIWKGDNLRRLRNLHCQDRYDEVELCEACTVWSLFPKFWEKRSVFGIWPTGVWK